MLLAWATGESLFTGTGYISSLTFRLTFGAVCVLGLGPLFLYNKQRQRGYVALAIVAMMAALVSYSVSQWLVAPAVVLLLGATAYFFRSEVPGARFSPAAAAALIPTLCIALVVASLLQWSETKVNLMFSLLSPPFGMNYSFPNKSTLAGLNHAQMNPAVALRYFSQQPSTHLVARSYATYAAGTWDAAPEGAVNVTGSDVGGGSYRFDRFPAGHGPVLDESIEMAGSTSDRISPRDAHALLVATPVLGRVCGETYQLPAGLEQHQFHILRSPGHFPQDFGPDPRPPFLGVPDDLRPTLEKMSRGWGATPALPSDTVEIKLRRCKLLESYFQDHFTYGFGYPFEKKSEPILAFLTEKPAAHCELFASSLALMLRCYDIPTRYINGYLVKEGKTWGGYYIVRARHAHAWVEAYVDGYGWVMLDPTPPSFTEQEDDVMTRFRAWSDSFFHFWNLFSSMSWEQLARAMLGRLRQWGPVLGALTVGVVAFGRRKALRFGWKSRQVAPAPPAREALGALLDSVEACLLEIGWKRRPGQTLLALAREKDDKGPAGIFLKGYCDVFYGQSQPTPADIQQLTNLRDEVQSWVQSLILDRQNR